MKTMQKAALLFLCFCVLPFSIDSCATRKGGSEVQKTPSVATSSAVGALVSSQDCSSASSSDSPSSSRVKSNSSTVRTGSGLCTPSSKTTATSKAGTSGSSSPTSANPDQVYFGIYHVDPLMNNAEFQKELNEPYINCFFLSRGYDSRQQIADGARAAQAHGKKVWLSIGEAIFNYYSDRTELNESWKQRVDDIMTLIRKENGSDSVLGFYFDEPDIWRISSECLHDVSMYLRTQYPGKRVFVCFSIGCITPDIWTDTSRIKEQLNPYEGQYLTDVAFDYYAPYNHSQYRYIADTMEQKLGNRPDLKIWYIPATMNYLGNKTESYTLLHLQGMEDLLKEEKNPGGLMCYTYHTFPADQEALGNIGLDNLLNPSYKDYWPELGNLIQTVGKQVIKLR